MTDWPNYFHPKGQEELHQNVLREYNEMMNKRYRSQTTVDAQKIKILIESAILLIGTDPEIAIDHLESVLDLL